MRVTARVQTNEFRRRVRLLAACDTAEVRYRRLHAPTVAAEMRTGGRLLAAHDEG
jgi:hypothetical protein